MNITETLSTPLLNVVPSQLNLMRQLNVLLIILMIVLSLASIMSTIYDIIGTKQRKEGGSQSKISQILLSFSFYTNGRKLFNLKQNEREIGCIEGLRAIAMFYIVYLHTYFFRFLTPYRDEKVFNEFMNTTFAGSVSSSHMMVDSFFVISGMLTTISLLKDFENNNFNYFKLFFQRFMRISPLLAFMILFNNSLAYYFIETAPPNFLDFSSYNCQKHWWETILNLQVYTNPDEICMQTTWYLSVDFQMTVIVAPILVFILHKYEWKGLALIVLLIASSVAYAFKVVYENEFIIRNIHLSLDIFGHMYASFYYPTHIRGAVYLVGIFLGYLLQRNDSLQEFVKNSSFLTKISPWGCWIAFLSLIAGASSSALIMFIVRDDLIHNALILSSIRIVWGFATAVVIYLCYCGLGGYLNAILSFKLFKLIGKLGLSIYLVHPVLQYNIISSKVRELNLGKLHMLNNFIMDFSLAFVVAIFLHLLVEEPFHLIGKYLCGRGKRIESEDFGKTSQKKEEIKTSV